jgi:hypothetical protein
MKPILTVKPPFNANFGRGFCLLSFKQKKPATYKILKKLIWIVQLIYLDLRL